ncbi:MAG: hypothetical protein HFG80_01280 [Eubacterium sp.]|nr:hypothetical protein [Eubacterium sp.]
MKKLIPVLLIACFIYFLVFPADLMQSVANGLTIWYRNILPSMLPFAFLSTLILESGTFYTLNKILAPLLRCFFPALENGYFPFVTGFFFGFPFGSKITADLTAAKKLPLREGNLICSISNNVSPAFTINIVQQALFLHFAPTAVTLFLLYFPPLLIGWLYHRKIFGRRTAAESKKAAPRFQFNFKIIDAAIMNAFETMLKLCGYIVLFAVICNILENLFSSHTILTAIGMNLFEISNGAVSLKDLPLPVEIKYLIMLPALSFGGISCLCQSVSMMKPGNLSVGYYVKFKLLTAVMTFLLTFLYLTIFHR